MLRSFGSWPRRALRSAARSIFIQVEKTPNPFSLKFLPTKLVLPEDHAGSGYHFHKGDKDYLRSPLAKKLLGIPDVTGVFVGKDFITISKNEGGAWAVIKPFAFSYLMDWFAEGVPAVEDMVQVTDTTILDDDSEIVAMIKELLESRIRPSVQEDGGDIFYKGFDVDTGVVSVQLAGSCVGCPSSSVTLRNGVEKMLMHYIPEVTGIENVELEEEPSEDNDFGRKLAKHEIDEFAEPVPPAPRDDPRMSV